MLQKLLAIWSLMAVCVGVHAAGLAYALRWLARRPSLRSFWSWTSIFVAIAGWMVLLHMMEICTWAVYYLWVGAMPDLPTAVYFSGVTYTTTGYGDVVLPPGWRLLGGVEALTGILMCGWSTGFFFAVVSRLYAQGATATTERLPVLRQSEKV